MDSRRYRAGAARKPAWIDYRPWLPHPCAALRHAHGAWRRPGRRFPGLELRPRPGALYGAGESGSTYPHPGGARGRRPSGQGTSVAQNAKYGRDRRGNQAGLDRRDARALVDGGMTREPEVSRHEPLQRGSCKGTLVIRWCIIPHVFPEGKGRRSPMSASLIEHTPSAYDYPLLIKHLLHTPLATAPEQA